MLCSGSITRENVALLKKIFWPCVWVWGWLVVLRLNVPSQSTIFQSCRDGAIASWVINQYFRGVKCLAQGHNTAEVGLEPRTSRSGVQHSTTEPPRSPVWGWVFWGEWECKLVWDKGKVYGCKLNLNHRQKPALLS